VINPRFERFRGVFWTADPSLTKLFQSGRQIFRSNENGMPKTYHLMDRHAQNCKEIYSEYILAAMSVTVKHIARIKFKGTKKSQLLSVGAVSFQNINSLIILWGPLNVSVVYSVNYCIKGFIRLNQVCSMLFQISKPSVELDLKVFCTTKYFSIQNKWNMYFNYKMQYIFNFAKFHTDA